MTPQQFISKWRQVNLTERSTAQLHFIDLCDVLNVARPLDDDPTGASYTFERGAHKVGGGEGWADVWKRGCFGWEYKRKRRDLKAAYDQLLQYREDLENPPLLVVCDMDRFEIHTNFTGTAKQVYRFDLDGFAQPENLSVLRRVFDAPGDLRPQKTKESVTKAAAESFGDLATGLRKRHVPAKDAAHFLMKLMFCMFAEDIELLPNKVFKRCLESAYMAPSKFKGLMAGLFQAMARGGDFGPDSILHFNGGLFADANVIELNIEELAIIRRVAAEDWSAVEPSIFGTLFERSFDPDKEELIGAHYTSREDIETLLRPVMLAPLRREWDDVKQQCETLWPEIQAAARKQTKATAKGKAGPLRAKFNRLIQDFVERLSHVTVLDPACGSGNFLYVALHLLLDLEKEVITYAASHGVSQLPHVRPTQLSGIEINPYAQELAQVVIWIGYLQWMRDNGFSPPRNPVLEPIESIRRMDAILDLSNPSVPFEPDWPAADFIVGNPPFLGNKLMREGLGEEYLKPLWQVYGDRLPGMSDLCCYWFEKGRHMIETGKAKRVALLATTGIKQVGGRRVLERIVETGRIFWAISDRDWVLDGASTRICMVGFEAKFVVPPLGGKQANNRVKAELRTSTPASTQDATTAELDGKQVAEIHADLTAGNDLTATKTLASNASLCFMGTTKVGGFDIPDELAIKMLHSVNPHGQPTSDVIRPFRNGSDLVQKNSNRWIIDFGVDASLEQAALFETPFDYVVKNVKPDREKNNDRWRRQNWWKLGRGIRDFREATANSSRYIGTARVAKHRLFVWLDTVVLPDSKVIAIAFDDDFRIGVLSSRLHTVWTLAKCGWHGIGNDATYNPTTCFETFPFPEPTEAQRAAIAAAARELDELRNNWLNPPEWTQTETLEFPGSTTGPWARYVDPKTVRPSSPHVPTEEPSASDSRKLREASEASTGKARHVERDGYVEGIGTVRYPRLVPRDVICAGELKKRTLTNLYNQRPTWLDLAHRKLDEAVFAAYGWSPTLSDDELLAALLRLNLERAADHQ